MGKHIPLRMCMACREMKPKHELIRVVYKDGDMEVKSRLIRTYGASTYTYDFSDFINRVSGKDMNKRAVESLIKAGAFDSLPHNRHTLLNSYDHF